MGFLEEGGGDLNLGAHKYIPSWPVSVSPFLAAPCLDPSSWLEAEDGGHAKRRASSCFHRFSSSALIASFLFISCPCSNLLVRSLGCLMAYFLGGAFSSSLTLCHETRGKGSAATHTLAPGVCRLSDPTHRMSQLQNCDCGHVLPFP